MSIAVSIAATEHPLDERLARAAVTLGLGPIEENTAVENAAGGKTARDDDAADRLIALAAGNRTAVVRALGRVAGGGHAAQLLRLALSRGSWSW